MYIRVKSFTKCSNLVQSEPFQLQTVIFRQHHFFCCKQVFFAKQSFLAKLSSQQKTAIHCKVFLLESSCYTQVALIEGHFFVTIVIITVKLSEISIILLSQILTNECQKAPCIQAEFQKQGSYTQLALFAGSANVSIPTHSLPKSKNSKTRNQTTFHCAKLRWKNLSDEHEPLKNSHTCKTFTSVSIWQ